MKDITLLELVDLDRSPNNRIVSIYYPERKEYLPCPHNIVTTIGNIARENINEALEINNAKGQKYDDYKHAMVEKTFGEINDMNLKDLINSTKESTNLLKEIQERMKKLEEKIEFVQNESQI